MGEIDEAELVSAGQCGAVIDGRADGGKRTVQAALLRSCCHELKDRIDPRGLRLANVIVAGGLDLSGLVVPFSRSGSRDASSTPRPWWRARSCSSCR
jgi:hypothetical protein